MVVRAAQRRRRLLWVVPRFGEESVGGAERLIRELATRATPEPWESEIATTCARSHYTWENELEPGESRHDGVLVRRFLVGPRNAARYDELHGLVVNGEATYVDELEWLSNSVWSPELQAHLERSGNEYGLLIFSPYLFGTTVWGAQVDPGRSALVPCLHDEPYARLTTVRRVLESVRGCCFNSPAEERLARRLSAVHSGHVVGMGFDPPTAPSSARFAEPRGLGPYLLYAGRIEEGKRVDVAVEYALRYSSERPSAPQLVLIGQGSYEPPEEAADLVVRAGFVNPEERRAAYAEAVALVNPSHLESLSIVLMEAWLEGTPAVVAAGSDVLREHCERSGGGLAFGSYEEYRDAVDRLLSEPHLGKEMGAAGHDYVLETYGWPAVKRRFREAIEILTE
jgi:glycosyltransferase involved in cell wall biosynthesis